MCHICHKRFNSSELNDKLRIDCFDVQNRAVGDFHFVTVKFTYFFAKN